MASGKSIPKFVTTQAAAAASRRKVRGLDRLIAGGHLRSVKIKLRRLIPEDTLCELIWTATSARPPKPRDTIEDSHG